MRACFCSLAGTRHCDYCSNGPSRMMERPIVININTGNDPEDVKSAFMKAMEELQEKTPPRHVKTYWSTSTSK